MATEEYMSGRKKYQRPQALMFSENMGIPHPTSRTPEGYEVGADTTGVTDSSLLNQFLILSDDNRQPIDFKMIRLEKRERMINGRMRSYHIADKKSFSVSWNMLPSRAFAAKPNFDSVGKTVNIDNNGYRSGYQSAPVTITAIKSDDIVVTIPAITINQLSGNKMIPRTISAVYAEDTTTTIPEISFTNDAGILVKIPTRYIYQHGVHNDAVGVTITPGIDTDGPTVQYVIPQHIYKRPGNIIGVSRIVGVDPDGTAITHLGEQYTTDGGAGGVEILDWYETHTGPFWVFAAYDKFNNFSNQSDPYAYLAQYSELLEMYITDFSYSVQKRGGNNYDFWNISMTLEEV